MKRLRTALFLVCLLFGVASPSRAPYVRATCLCMVDEDWNAKRRGSSALFTGIVIADSSQTWSPDLPSDSLVLDLARYGRKVTLLVEHAWKLSARSQTDSILVSVTTPGTDCGVSFGLYERYLVAAISGTDWARLVDSVDGVPGRTRLSHGAAATLWTDRCMGTRPIAEARQALRQLGPGVPIADSGPPRPPNR